MIEKLQNFLNSKQKTVQTWMEKQRKDLTMPIYASFDIRDNGTKASIVDSNLFPSGFHRLNKEAQELSSTYFREGIEKTYKKVTNILLYPLPYTKNVQYVENLAVLSSIISKAGFTVIVGKPFEAKEFPNTLSSKDKHVQFVNLRREKKEIVTEKGTPDLIILNTDLYKGIPLELRGLKQPMMPTPELGWHSRTKYAHFVHYNTLAKKFSRVVGIDPWLLHAEIEEVLNADFRDVATIKKVATITGQMLERISSKYKEYNITSKPYVVIKDNSGTYGRGIFIAESEEQVLAMNSAARRNMQVGHESHPIDSVIIQEGIETTYYNEFHGTGEPVIYQVGRRIVGGFMRVHKEKSARENLNSPGMEFVELSLNCLTQPLTDCVTEECEASLYGILADLATLAIGLEIKDLGTPLPMP